MLKAGRASRHDLGVGGGRSLLRYWGDQTWRVGSLIN